MTGWRALTAPACRGSAGSGRDDPAPRIGIQLALGSALIGLLLLGSGGWACLAPLATSAVAIGALETDAAPVALPSPATATVSEVLVHEGDRVAAGQLLARLDGRLGVAEGRIAALGERDAEARTEIAALDRQAAALHRQQQLEGDDPRKSAEIGAGLAGVDAERARARRALLDSADRLAALRGSAITAPMAGIVAELDPTLTGRRLQPGDPVLTLRPTGDALVVVARLRPEDIAGVHAGLPAAISFPGLKRHSAPELAGTVVAVSADRLIDRRSGEAYFAVRVALDGAEVNRHAALGLVPGMPAEAVIETGRTSAPLAALAPLLEGFGSR